MNRKGEMGIGLLIFFMTVLVISVIAAVVVIQTTGDARERAYQSGSQAKYIVATAVSVMEVSATDGTGGNVSDFQMDLKLTPGAEEIKLDLALLTFTTFDKDISLKYAGNNSNLTNDPSGYLTNKEDEIGQISDGEYIALQPDLDGDQKEDYVGINTTHVLFNISGESSQTTIPLTEALTGGNTLSVDSRIKAGSTDYGRLQISGITTTAGQIDENLTFLITPTDIDRGTFAVEFLQNGINHINGNLQRGDVARFYFQAPRDIVRGENVRISFIPKIGTPVLVEFHTPDVIHNEREYLYPK